MTLHAATLQVIGVLFVASFVRATLGFGEALVAVPLLALLMPVRVAAPVAVLVSITVAAGVLARDWRHVHLRSAGWLIASTVVGIPLGLLLLTRVPAELVKACLGALILVFSGYSLLRRRTGALEHDRYAWLFGFSAGVLGGAFGMNGPPLAIYGTLRGWSTQRFRATLQGYFLPASMVAMVGFAAAGLWNPAVTHYYLVSLPGVLIATLLGQRTAGRMDTRLFLRAVNVGLMVVAAVLIAQSLPSPRINEQGGHAMATSRRRIIQSLSVGAAALVSARSRPALAQEKAPQQERSPRPLPLDFGSPSSAEDVLHVVSCARLEAEARRVLTPGRFAIMGWQGDGWTYHENLRAFNDHPIAPRRLQAVKEEAIDLRTSILGHSLSLPMITCPMGGHENFHVEGEVASARGTGMAGTLYVSSGAANRTLEEIAAATAGPRWFQIYMNRDMQINRWLVQRARAAGFTAIVLTADALGPGHSDDYIALGMPRDPNLQVGNSDPARGGRGTFADFKRDLSFDDIGFLREASGLPVITKGVVEPDDIRAALQAGAAAIWISNHGGRQMDGVPASFTLLRAAADTVAGRVPIIFDSGIRRGIDVFKALSMGATVVGVGRPVLWGLICGGSQGVASVYAQLASELHNALLLSGVAKVTALNRSHIVMQDA